MPEILLVLAVILIFFGAKKLPELAKGMGQGIKELIGLGTYLGSGFLLVASALASSVTDNIPLAAMLAKMRDLLFELSGDREFRSAAGRGKGKAGEGGGYAAGGRDYAKEDL